MRHFRTLPVVEKDALNLFLYTVKSNKNKLDLKPNNDNVWIAKPYPVQIVNCVLQP